MNQPIAEIQGLPVILAPDVINETLMQEVIQNKRYDVAEWLCKQELVYISTKTTKCNDRFWLLNITDNISEALNYYVYSRKYSVITLHLKYVNMHKAIGEPAVLYWLLQHGGNMEELDSKGRTLLHSTIEKKLFDIFYLLLEMGVDVNAQDSRGWAPLHLAVLYSEEMVHCLIQHGCDIDAQNHDGHTALFRAVDCRNEEVICMLLCYNANTEIGCEFTPFIHAMLNIFRNNNIVLEILLEYQSDINAPTNEGLNALYYAIFSDNPLEAEIIRRGGLLPTEFTVSHDAMLCAVNRNEMSLFKFVFATFDMKRLKLRHFCDFIGNNSFPRDEWIKYLYLILRSKFANKVLSLVKRASNRNNVSLYIAVLTAFKNKDVREKDRIKILKMLFEQKIPIELIAVDKIYDFYGFNSEIELLFKMPIRIVGKTHGTCAAKFIFIFESFASDRLKVELYDYLLHYLLQITIEGWRGKAARGILALGRFISLRQHVPKFKNLLCETHHSEIEKIMKVIDEMPIVPSLEELSRNAVRAAIGRKFPGKNTLFYQKCLNKLQLPSIIMDIIRLKVPIYKDFTPLYLEK